MDAVSTDVIMDDVVAKLNERISPFASEARVATFRSDLIRALERVGTSLEHISFVADSLDAESSLAGMLAILDESGDNMKQLARQHEKNWRFEYTVKSDHGKPDVFGRRNVPQVKYRRFKFVIGDTFPTAVRNDALMFKYPLGDTGIKLVTDMLLTHIRTLWKPMFQYGSVKTIVLCSDLAISGNRVPVAMSPERAIVYIDLVAALRDGINRDGTIKKGNNAFTYNMQYVYGASMERVLRNRVPKPYPDGGDFKYWGEPEVSNHWLSLPESTSLCLASTVGLE